MCYFKEGRLGLHYAFILVVKIIVFVSHTATLIAFDIDELNLTQPFALQTKSYTFVFKNHLSK